VIATALSIRPARADDQAFVAATFAEQLARGHHADANQVVDRVLDSTMTRVIVACDEGRILGWLAYSAIPRVRAVLFVYVRRQARERGVARELVDAAWPSRGGAWVHGGLRGATTRSLLERHRSTAMDLEDLL
jgi:predicted N-acetyltransferase YhbS